MVWLYRIIASVQFAGAAFGFIIHDPSAGRYFTICGLLCLILADLNKVR